MSLKSLSSFIYGHQVTQYNRYLSFDEGNGELIATLNNYSFTLTKFATEIARAMSEAGTQDYTCTVDRETRKLTISAASSFSLLIGTGATSGSSIFSLAGFSGADLSGSNTYEGDLASGSIYKPQMLLQEYVPFENFQNFSDAHVNTALNGDTEIISFGRVRFMQCNIKNATNNRIGTVVGKYEENTSAVDELRSFYLAITEGQKVEFMPDRDAPGNFYSCILKSTPESKDGIGFKLNEYLGKTPDFYESGKLVFREVQ